MLFVPDSVTYSVSPLVEDVMPFGELKVAEEIAPLEDEFTPFPA
jgi:hypothetical protein